ncbi:large exoprotein [Microbacterium sp. 2216-1]|uniref:large exoprotein n=1 Tax=Microbacterium sp. 2216-1 TaxID=3390053 RepID=UPI0039771A61
MDYDPYGYGAFSAMIALVSLLLLILGPIMYVVVSLFLMKVFEKAGVEGKWRAWVPVYNTMILFKLGDLSPWLVLYAIGASLFLSWIPVIGQLVGLAAFALSALAAWRVGLKLQKEAVWVLLYVFLSPVWLGILAFDKSRWNAMIAPAPWAGNAFFADKTTWEGVPAQPGQNIAPPAPGYGAAPQGYAPPQGYQPPAQPGYSAPPQPGQAAPAQPGYGAPVPPAPGAPVPPPAAPPAPPTAPPAPPAAPPAPPAAAPEEPRDPNQPQA